MHEVANKLRKQSKSGTDTSMVKTLRSTKKANNFKQFIMHNKQNNIRQTIKVCHL